MQGVYFCCPLFICQGANSYGQLGAGNAEDTPLPVVVDLESSEEKNLKQIVGGGGHTLLLTCKL